MHEIKKYYVFLGPKKLFLNRSSKNSWMKFFRVGSFIRIFFFSDGYINLRFSGICITKSFCGVSSTFRLKDRFGMDYQFFFFSPTINRIILIKF